MFNIAIVGGGPTAVYVLQALVESQQPFAATLFESGRSLGWGTPYDPDLNAPSLLANIASFELPPVEETLADWLRGLPAGARRRFGVGDEAIDERGFYPRIAIGAYFAAQLRALVARAEANGARIALRRGVRVVDVEGQPDGATVRCRARGGPPEQARFDDVILATGHRGARPKLQKLTAPAYPAPEIPPDRPIRVAILGASLTAIDAAVSLALQRGAFESGVAGLVYRPQASAAPLSMEMLSRRGVLPEADFYFPYPYAPLRFCSPEALTALQHADPARRLDLAFDLLRRELFAEAPAFAQKVGLDRLTADSFANAYLALRGGRDPFVAARCNLAKAREGVRRRNTSAWRYVLLRAHEAFGELTPYFAESDAARFRAGLQRVFVDNYAAVPPLSIERILALRAAGVLTLRKLAAGYRLQSAQDSVEIVEGQGTTRYDLAIDARGQRAASAREIPFPTLRSQILANQMTRPADAEIEVDAHLRLAAGVNPVNRIYCLAAPFLLAKRPFVQGLTATHELAHRAVAHLLHGQPAPSPTNVCYVEPALESA